MKKVVLAMALVMFGTAANAMSPGRYEQKLGDGSTDILLINQDGSMSIEQTRQIGGPGGISNEGVVPYPTVCRVKTWGKFVSQDAQYIQYQAKYMHQTDLPGLRETEEHCDRYIGEFNGRALTGQVRFSLKKSDYTRK
ncbi:MAG: hypothetical protein IPL83_15715 [Bdellovibrionales bacterium]|nr:hypothetical protein [Bdellovibrionales bacterium]